MTDLLLLEDDESLGATLCECLREENYHVTWAVSIAQARVAVKAAAPQIALIDVMLPDGSGFDFARELKKTCSPALIFLTAVNTVEQRLEGFELGAADYIPKPFHLKELLLRVKKVVVARPYSSRLRLGTVTIDFKAVTISDSSGDAVDHPAPNDMRLLELLVRNSPRVLSRKELQDQVWGTAEETNLRTVDNAVMRLRQSLGAVAGEYIRSVRGVGYQWLAKV